MGASNEDWSTLAAGSTRSLEQQRSILFDRIHAPEPERSPDEKDEDRGRPLGASVLQPIRGGIAITEEFQTTRVKANHENELDVFGASDIMNVWAKAVKMRESDIATIQCSPDSLQKSKIIETSDPIRIAGQLRDMILTEQKIHPGVFNVGQLVSNLDRVSNGTLLTLFPTCL